MVLAGTFSPSDAAMAPVTDDVVAATTHIEKHAGRTSPTDSSVCLGEPLNHLAVTWVARTTALLLLHR